MNGTRRGTAHRRGRGWKEAWSCTGPEEGIPRLGAKKREGS